MSIRDPFKDIYKIFDDFNKRFFKDDFFDFGIEEDFMKDFFDFKKTKNKMLSLEKVPEYGRSYSISYNYETGMDEPEIKIVGNPTKEEVNSFLQGIPKDIRDKIDFKDVTKLVPENTEDAIKKPITELNIKDNKAMVTMEIPGISKEQVELKCEGNKVLFKAKTDDIVYAKEIELPFEPDEKSITYELKNGVMHLQVKPKE